jgi:hypothetical protein
MRIPQTDRFETTLPKEHFFNSPPVKKVPKQSKRDWHAVIITGIVAVTLIAAIKQITQHLTLSPAGVAPVATPAPPPPSPDAEWLNKEKRLGGFRNTSGEAMPAGPRS